MANGYTHKIEAGISFEDFVKTCASAFDGRCRDGAKFSFIPVQPSSYYVSSLEYARKQLQELKAESKAAAVKRIRASRAENKKDEQSRSQKNAHLREKYDAMLKQVQEWVVPASLDALKKFMIQQIEESVAFDCHESCSAPEEGLANNQIEQIIKQEIADCKLRVKRAEQSYRAEIKHVKQANRWIKTLAKALGEKLNPRDWKDALV